MKFGTDTSDFHGMFKYFSCLLEKNSTNELHLPWPDRGASFSTDLGSRGKQRLQMASLGPIQPTTLILKTRSTQID
jgi:hypothetical protein